MKSAPLYFLAAMLITTSACQLDDWQKPVPPNYGIVRQPCNGDSSLCTRRYDQVTYAATHKSYNYELGLVNYLSPSQKYPVKRQLEDGIRGIFLDIYDQGGSLIVANKNPLLGNLLGSEPLSHVLTEMREFMDANPREVVTLFLNTTEVPSRIGNAFANAGLNGMLADQSSSPWPTLEEMILSGKRLVVFYSTDFDPPQPTWYRPMSTGCYQSDATANARSEWDCGPLMSPGVNGVYIIHHRAETPLLNTASADSARAVNAFPVLFPRVASCFGMMMRPVNFIVVDYCTEGDLMQVVDSLNHYPTPVE